MFRYASHFSALTLAAVLACGGAAHAQSDVQLIQPGDGDMTCEALASEINTLSSAEAKAAKRAESGKKFMGFATAALQVAGPMLSSGMGKMGGDFQGAMLAQQAMGQLQGQAMQQQMVGLNNADGVVDASSAGSSIERQRLSRMKDLHARKRC